MYEPKRTNDEVNESVIKHKAEVPRRQERPRHRETLTHPQSQRYTSSVAV